jgi:uncharacterized membrane protein
MKKSLKNTLFVIAGLTIIVVTITIIMLKAILGDVLFYMDSRFGGIYAVSYRWMCLVSVILILFWILIIVKNRAVITAKMPKFKRKPKEGAEATPPVMVCAHCGRPLTAANKFCPQCGEPAPSEGKV